MSEEFCGESKDDSEYLIPEIKVDPFSLEFKNLGDHAPGGNIDGKEAASRKANFKDIDPQTPSLTILPGSEPLDFSKLDFSKLDFSKQDSPKLDFSKQDSPKLDFSKLDSPKLDSSLQQVSNTAGVNTIAPSPVSSSGDQARDRSEKVVSGTIAGATTGTSLDNTSEASATDSPDSVISDLVIPDDDTIDILPEFQSSQSDTNYTLRYLYKFASSGLPNRSLKGALAPDPVLSCSENSARARSQQAGLSSKKASTKPVAFDAEKASHVRSSSKRSSRSKQSSGPTLIDTSAAMNIDCRLGNMVFNKEKMCWESVNGNNLANLLNILEDEGAPENKENSNFTVTPELWKKLCASEASHTLLMSLWYPKSLSKWTRRISKIKGPPTISCEEYLQLVSLLAKTTHK